MNLVTAIKKKATECYCNYRDYRTSRQVVVFESDDWGSIRMSSREAWESLRNMGYPVDKRPYERFDILESDDDITALAEVLLKYTDRHGNHPVMTLNYLSANPDFDAIRENGMTEYHFEPIAETYNKYPYHHNVLNIVREGINKGLFMPQCHGREHYNVKSWMRSLQSGDTATLDAFRYNMCGIAPTPNQGNQFTLALKCSSVQDQEFVCQAIGEGLTMFEKLWGYPSTTFVAPNYTWNNKIESVLHDKGVQLLQTVRIQHISDRQKDIQHYSGEQNKLHQYYSLRNCFFEPATSQAPDKEVDNCLRSIQRLFEKHKIAVISTHRINYVSGIDEKNRNNTLLRLDNLLSKITKEYPEVEFLSSNQLIELFKSHYYYDGNI